MRGRSFVTTDLAVPEAPAEPQAPLRLHIAADNDPSYEDTIPIDEFGILPLISDCHWGSAG